MSDGNNTELLGGLPKGTVIVTAIEEATEEAPAVAQEQSPFAPKRNDKKK